MRPWITTCGPMSNKKQRGEERPDATQKQRIGRSSLCRQEFGCDIARNPKSYKNRLDGRNARKVTRKQRLDGHRLVSNITCDLQALRACSPRNLTHVLNLTSYCGCKGEHGRANGVLHDESAGSGAIYRIRHPLRHQAIPHWKKTAPRHSPCTAHNAQTIQQPEANAACNAIRAHWPQSKKLDQLSDPEQ